MLEALEDAKNYFDMIGQKNNFQKHITATNKQLEKLKK